MYHFLLKLLIQFLIDKNPFLFLIFKIILNLGLINFFTLLFLTQINTYNLLIVFLQFFQ